MSTKEELLTSFKPFDVDGNGKLDKSELKAILIREGNDQMTEDDAEAILDAMIAGGHDTDGDGKLSLEELAAAWAQSDDVVGEVGVKDNKEEAAAAAEGEGQ